MNEEYPLRILQIFFPDYEPKDFNNNIDYDIIKNADVKFNIRDRLPEIDLTIDCQDKMLYQ